MEMSPSIGAIAAALSKFQAAVKQPKKDAKNPHFGSMYVPLEGIVDVIAEPLEKNGLSYIQNTFTHEQDAVVQTIVMHESGEWIMTDAMSLPALQKKKDGVTEFNAQGAGSAITYARRYQLAAALGIASESDDDGNEATANGRAEQPKTQQRSQSGQQPQRQNYNQQGNSEISQAQINYCNKLIKDKFVSPSTVLDALGVYGKDRVDQLSKGEASKFIEFLNNYQAASPTSDDELPF